MDRREVEKVERRLNQQARKVISLQARNAELEAENAALRRQRDELHATTARYWNRIIANRHGMEQWVKSLGDIVRGMNAVRLAEPHANNYWSAWIEDWSLDIVRVLWGKKPERIGMIERKFDL